MSDKKQNEDRYFVTPLGILSAELGPKKADEVWDCLRRFAQAQLDYHEQRGIPCIVLDGGGAVIAVEKESDDDAKTEG